MKALCTFLILMLLAGCMSTSAIRSMNRENLSKLSLGMSKQDVFMTMGTKTITADDGTKINNPWRTEIITGDDGKFYEILFYYTDVKESDGAINDNELTPIVVSDNKVIGWGWSYLHNKDFGLTPINGANFD